MSQQTGSQMGQQMNQNPHPCAGLVGQPQLQPQQHDQPISQPTSRDVLNGRGQGVQRHPGNVKYRTLVFVNKGLYAKCPRTDKIKISKGIVKAIRELGGRFLELDERSGIYRDIGDKKATEKTSQALREGQKEIRQELYRQNEQFNVREMSADGYALYSIQVLESLHNGEGPPTGPNPEAARAAAFQQQQQQQAAVPATVSSSMNAAQREALADQFGVQFQEPAAQKMPELPEANVDLSDQIGRFTDAEMRITDQWQSFRLTNMSGMSMLSINSLKELIESARSEQFQPLIGGDGRSSDLQSVLTNEIRDLIRLSEPQLRQAESIMDDITGGGGGSPSAVKEVEMKDTQEDRVSELRFTDVARDIRGEGGAAGPSRSSESTNYSKTSVMDQSIMTIDPEDMSHAGRGTGGSSEDSAKKQKTNPPGTKRSESASEDARLLLGLTDEQMQQAV